MPQCLIAVTIGAHVVDVVARQDGHTRVLLAEIALGARLQARLARQIRGDVLETTDRGEEALQHRDEIQHHQEKYKQTSQTKTYNITRHLFYLSFHLKISAVLVCCGVGKTGRPVVGGKAGGFVPTHQPFMHAVPNGQGGCATPHCWAFGS